MKAEDLERKWRMERAGTRAHQGFVDGVMDRLLDLKKPRWAIKSDEAESDICAPVLSQAKSLFLRVGMGLAAALAFAFRLYQVFSVFIPS